jgi:AcrR family transcriptional regulator
MLAGVSPPRAYRSEQRRAQAALTRRRVLEAATEVFVAKGYAASTMREVAARAAVSVPTVELLFGTKARLLKAAIDVAIAGDAEPVAVLDRDWARTASRATDDEELLGMIADVLAAAQQRSAGLVLAVFEGARSDADLAEQSTALVAQRAGTAAWIVERLADLGPLRADISSQEAVDTVWLLMDPAIFERLTRHRQWSVEQYRRWIADAIRRLCRDGHAHPVDQPPTQTAQRRTT